MLEIRPTCENCNKPLPPDSTEAMICTFECTYCRSCALEVFENVCPNCGGGFNERPIRPEVLLRKYPPSDQVVYKPKDMQQFQKLLTKYKDIKPEDR